MVEGGVVDRFDLIAALIVLVAAFSYLNFRFLKLPSTIGVMVISLAFSAALGVLGSFVPAVAQSARGLVGQLDFSDAVLHGMLGFLLFAGSLHVDIGQLRQHKGPIAVLATFGVLVSTVVVGALVWGISNLAGLGLRPIDCFLFGALIAPTDPIAVLGLLKELGAPERLKIQIVGESLFNDGIGVVVFLGLLSFADGSHHAAGPGQVATLFLQEVVGGAAFGLAIGAIVYLLMRSVDNYQVEILLSLALVAGGYAAASYLHVSGPLAMVVAGLLIGNHGRAFAMSPRTTERLDLFWELVDEVLNVTLFVLVGLEVLVLDLSPKSVLTGLLAIPVVLAARLVSVNLSVRLLGHWVRFEPAIVRVLTWGGLRGAISVALALSLPATVSRSGVASRNAILTVTYVVVTFSILVQGLTVGPLTRRWLGREE